MADSLATEDVSKPSRYSRFFRRWRRRVLVFLLFAVIGYVFRGPLLRSAARVLIVDDEPATCSRVAILDGDRRYDRAVELIAGRQVDGVVLVESSPKRLQRLGLVPMPLAVDRSELAKRGVPAAQIEIVPGQARTAWDWARQLGGWLERNPDATVLVLCDRFNSRHDRLIFRQALPPEQFARIRIAALPNREHDETNWWHNKDGALAFGHHLLGLTHVWIVGEPEPPPEQATAAELEDRGK
jgi:hypothetical protein